MTLRRIHIIFVFITCGFVSGAQTSDSIKIIGQITADSVTKSKLANGIVRLAPTRSDGQYFSTKVKADGSFIITVPVTQPELYELKYNGYKMDVLVTPSESVFNLAVDVKNMQVDNMKAVGSHQYEAYRAFKHINNAFREKLHDLTDDSKKDPKTGGGKMKKEIASFNSSLDFLRQSFKGTFAADVLAPMAELPEMNDAQQPLSFLQQHFFDNADLSDMRLYNTPDLGKSISSYVDYIADTSATARVAFIASLYKLTKGKKDAQTELLTLLLGLFIDANREDYLSSIVQWGQTTSSLTADQPVMDSKIKLLAKTLPGATATEVTGEDVNGRIDSLTETIKANKLTLLIFWASDCVHCRKSMPEFIKLYNQYHAKGLEIFGASVEPEKEDWKQFVTKQHLEWTNIILPPNSTAHADYYIQYTPTLVLINNNSVIIRRFMDVEDLNKIIGGILGK